MSEDPFEKEDVTDEPFVVVTKESLPVATSSIEVHPPASSSAVDDPQDSRLDAEIDLESTTPIKDLFLLFRKPRQFFMALADLPHLSAWVVLKTIVFFCFLSWLVGYFTGQEEMRTTLASLQPLMDQMLDTARDRLPSLFAAALDGEQVRSRLAVALVTGIQLSMMLKPLIALVFLFFTAATAYFFLPVVGIAKENRVSLGKIYIAGIYANWAVVLALIPFVGSSLASIAEVLLFVFALKWICKTTLWKSFLALYVLGWLLVMLTMVAGIFFIILFVSMAGNV